MKNIFCLLLISVLPLASSAGPRVIGGGGTSISAEFSYIGYTALSILADESVLPQSKVEEVFNKTLVYDVENICSQDPNSGQVECLDAQYLPATNKIQFDRNRWAKKTCDEQFVLSAHEYLRAAGLEDSNYKYSKLFLGGLKNNNIVLADNICNELRRLKKAKQQEQCKDSSHFCRCQSVGSTGSNSTYELIRVDIQSGSKVETSIQKNLLNGQCEKELQINPVCK